MQACGSLLSCTCCTSGEYKQLSDINRDNPGGGPGPNTCLFFFFSSSLWSLAVLKGSLQRKQAAEGKGAAAACSGCDAHRNTRVGARSWSPAVARHCACSLR